MTKLAIVWSGVLLASCSGSTTSGSGNAALASSSEVTFFHVGLGAGPMVFTDGDGRLLEERRYEPFGVAIDARIHGAGGDVIGPPDVAARDLNALNKRTDVTTGWSDHDARWMVPETGRWLTPDAAVSGPDASFMEAPWSLHPYQYVDQNPVMYWDPDGREKRPTAEQLTRIHDELRQHRRATSADAAKVAANGWKIVATTPSWPRGAGTYNTIVRGNLKQAVDKVLQLAGDAPIQRLAFIDHGYPGMQTFDGKSIFDGDQANGSPKIDPELLRLSGKFAKGGVLVFNGCEIMADKAGSQARTKEGMQFLAGKLGVEVRAGDQRNFGDKDTLWTSNVTACRADGCVTAWGEDKIDEAWRAKADAGR